MELNDLSYTIRGAAYDVHSKLGPGLLESVYERALIFELEKRGLQVRTQIILPLIYEGVLMENAYRIDILVNEEVIVEIKSVDSLIDVHSLQLNTYLKLADKRLGLLINFNSPSLIDRKSIIRLVNKF